MPQHRTAGHGPYSFATLLATVLLAALFAGAGAFVDTGMLGIQVALADDDDNGGGDDGGGGGDGGDSGGGDGGGNDDGDDDSGDDSGDDDADDFGDDFDDDNGDEDGDEDEPRLGNASGAAGATAQQRQADSLPARAPNEVIAAGLTADDVAALEGRGYAVMERTAMQQLLGAIVRLAVPSGTSLEDARAEIDALNAEAVTAFNDYYRTDTAGVDGESEAAAPCAGLGCAEKTLIGWPPGAGTFCGADARIGLIDTGINPDHETFEGSRLEVLPVLPESAGQSERKHGTAVAAILLGSAESRSPGLLPNATIIAVDAFYSAEGSDVRSDAYTLVKAMDRLASRDVSIINLSFSGPDNGVLAAMVARLAEDGVVLIAAAGNRGPTADPAFPAAYPDVIAVTAVDRNAMIYRRAGRGDHIDLAAPGVEVWTAASVRGARTKTGTSYAVPFVTATAALLEQELGITGHDAIAAELAARALDLGEPGKDPVYGHGLLQASGLCDAPAAGAPSQSG